MAVEITYRCDDCHETVTRPGVAALVLPAGWSAWVHDGEILHACPSCARLRRSVGWL